MASLPNGPNIPSLSYTKVLLLGAIAAASAFVVTIFILLLCVGCRRKARTKNAQTDTANHRVVDTKPLRQCKLRSMSKSDTGLHEMSRRACNGQGTSKSRPASMDLLLLPRQRSCSDLRGSQGRQLPQVPPTPGQEHTYSEVGCRSPPRPPDDALYESVPPAGPAPACSPTYGNSPANGGKGSNGIPVAVMMAAPQDPVTAEYACIRKVKKVERTLRREPGGREQQHGPNTDPPVTEGPRTAREAVHTRPFPKETVFMGNGEQYIWKPPEDDDIAIQQHKPASFPSMSHGESGLSHSTAVEISEMYSKVCKPTKKKRPPTSPLATRGTNGEDEEDVAGCERAQPQPWVGMRGGQLMEDPCYEAIGDKAFPGGSEESDPAYETIDSNWKRDRPPNATLKSKTRQQQQQLQQQQQQQQHLPLKALPSENFYESISDVKNGVTGASTTTIFTFNDGMEMYVTGL